MNRKIFSLVWMMALVCAVTARAYVYHETTNKVVSFDYSGFSYTYIDADGVEKTAMLTDEARGTEQICALLKEVYVNPEIPGIHYGYDFDGTQSRKMDYDFYGHLYTGSGFSWQRNSPRETFPNPNQDGMTMLLVSINDTWKSTMVNNNTTPEEHIRLSFSSARLMTAFTRVHDPENPGYLYQINDVSTNRFFFISKGKPRASHTRPLYRLYEQISPVKGDNGHVTDNFIDEMRAGHSFLCYHDCSEMTTIGKTNAPHWFSISNSGENYNLSNLTIFIPDRRFEPQHDPNGVVADNVKQIEVNGKRYFVDYGNSNDTNVDNIITEVMPKVLVYTVDLQATATPSEQDGYYDVHLTWDTNFTLENLDTQVPQQFYVYIIDGNNRVLLSTIVDQPTEDREHTYQVEQTNDTQTFSYIVSAHPINFDNDGNMLLDEDGKPLVTVSAESPVRTVIIPGRHSAFFTQAQEYRSRFEAKNINQQYNVYKNTMTIRPNSSDDYLSIKNNGEAYQVIRTDADGNRALVASVLFTPVDGTQEYEYTVTYNASTQVTNPVFDDETPVTSGRLTGFNNSTVVVIDRFLASTKDNDHSDRYIYSFEQLNEDGEMENFSNSFTVPVFKTTNEVGGQEHTFDEVWADTDHSAKAFPTNSITFDALSDPSANLIEYSILRTDYQYKKQTKIAKAEHSNNFDRYSLYSISEDGIINDFLGTVSITDDAPSITLPDNNNKDYNQRMLYAPVITTLYAGDINKKNTYGCDFKTMYYPQLTLTVNNIKKTVPFGKDGITVMGYYAKMFLTPSIPLSNMYAYYYRVWRVMEGETVLVAETLLNNEEDFSEPGPEPGTFYWATRYAPLRETFPEEAPWVEDIYLDLPFNGNKYVTYIARLYATTVNPDDVPEIDRMNIKSQNQTEDPKEYFIAEATKRVIYNKDVVTAIDDVDVDDDAQVAAITYYNVLGVPSSRPYAGINIVEMRFTDGKIKTVKVIK